MKRFAHAEAVPGCEARWVCSTEVEMLACVASQAEAAHGPTGMPPVLSPSIQAHIVAVG